MLLLTSPLSAMARVLTPPQNVGRQLLTSCNVDAWTGARGGSQTGIGVQSRAIQRVETDGLWVTARNNSCVSGGIEYARASNLTYAFDSAVGPNSDFQMLDDSMKNTVRQDLAKLSNSLNLTFHEISAAPVGRANLLFFQSRDPSSWTGDSNWGGTGPAGLVQPDVAGVFQGRTGGPTSDRLAAIGTALGLTGKGQVGYNNTNGLQGDYNTNTMSSVTFAQENTCVNVTDFGPLDLAALSNKYGWSSPDTVKIYDVRDTNNSAGILTSPSLGNGPLQMDGSSGNTLRAIYNGTNLLQLSITTDGSSITVVGNGYRMLAPNSVVLNADISQTRGGIVIGNNGTNHLLGSSFDDVFRPGAGVTNITTGSGSDSIILNYPGANVTVSDFSAQDTLYAPRLKNTTGVVGRAQGSGFSLQLPDEISVYLAGLQSFNMTRNFVVGTNPNNNFVALPCLYSRSAPVMPPPPPPPTATAAPSTSSSSGSSSNPCANIGSPGMGGALGACGSSLNIPNLVPTVTWNP